MAVKASSLRTQKRSVISHSPRIRNLKERRELYNSLQEAYVCLCVKNYVNPDRVLLQSLRNDVFTLKLDTFGQDELIVHMKALANCNVKEINMSFGSVQVNRDIRNKLSRLGLQRAFVTTSNGAAITLRSVSLASYKFGNLRCLQVRGIKIGKKEAIMLEKGIGKCQKLEKLDLSQSSLGDTGIGVLASTIGKSPLLHFVSLSQCKLTDGAKKDIIKLISVLSGITKDQTVWAHSLRCTEDAKCEEPRILLDLSKNRLGDMTIEAIEGCLSTDHWLLGINLRENALTERGMSIILDGCLQVNNTLSVMSVEEPANSCGIFTEKSENITLNRMQFLHRFANESKEKQFFLCEILLKWNVSKDIILDICGGSKFNTENIEIEAIPGDNQNVDSPEMVKMLLDRLNELQSSNQQTRDRLSRVSEENEKLRHEIQLLRSQNNLHPEAEDSKDMESEIFLIEQLEHSLSSLALQIEDLKAMKESG